MSRVTSNNK